MTARERNEIREFSGEEVRERGEWRGQGEDSESTSAGCIPVNTDIFLYAFIRFNLSYICDNESTHA